MAKMTRSEKVVRIEGMSVAGGELKLPQGFKYFVNLELDYSDVSFEEAIELASGGSSVRVQAQAKLRGNEKKLREHGAVAESLKDADLTGKTPIRFNVATDFENEGRTVDPEKKAASAFSQMTREQKVRFVHEDMGVTLEVAETMVPQEEEK